MSLLIGSTPNTQEDDIKLAKEILNGKVSTNEALELLKKEFPAGTLFFNKGRDSLYFFLSLLNLSNSDEVITQAFTCVAVVAPIIWNGAKPIYVDIEKHSFNMDIGALEKEINENTRVVIVQHTFGNIVDMGKVRNIVDKANLERSLERRIYIVEDCAHIFTKNTNNLDIGKYSDAYFFSFSQDKSISCTQGAAMVINDEKTKEIASREYQNLHELTKKEARYTVRYILLWNIIKKSYFKKIIPFTNITIGRILIILFRSLGIIKKQASENTLQFSEPQKMSNIQATLLLNQIKKAENFNNHRKNIVNIYNTRLDCTFKFNSNSNILIRYPVLLGNRKEIMSILRKKEIILGRWYSSVVFPLNNPEQLEKVGYIIGSCPNSEFCSNHILNIPTNIEMGKDDVETVIDSINSFAKNINLQ